MTKKIFSAMFVAVGMLFVTSCASDELTSSQTGGEATVSFSLALEDGIDTRAISDGSGADVLMYAVFDEDGKRISGISKVEKTGVSFPTREEITLAKGQTYKIAFWAQDADCQAYEVSDDMNVRIKYAGVNNDETRDAFFKSIEFTVTGSTSIDVILKRPFAQINVGVYESDWNAAVASGVEIEKSTATIVKAANTINLLTGKVGEETTDVTVDYTENAIPTEALMVDLDKDGTKEAYKWLSMSYILVADHGTTANAEGMFGAAATTLEDLGFSFIPKAGNAITFAQGLKSVPVQRNWRTNIIGKLLTGDITFNIDVDPIYDGEYIYPEGPAQQLEMAAATGGAVTLNKDVTLDKPLVVQGDMIINLNGKTLTGNLSVNAGATLSANGGSIVNNDETTSGIVSNGTLKLDDVNVTSARHALRIESGTAVINGGTYKVAPTSSKTVHAVNVGDDGTSANVVIKGGTFIGPKGTIADSGSAVNVRNGSSVKIEGGDFSGGKKKTLSGSDIAVSGGTFDQDPSAWVAPGYKAIKDGSKYVVVPETTAAIVSDAAALQTSIANINDGETIVLKEGTYSEIITLEGGKTYNIVANGNVVLPGVAHETNSLTSASTVTFEGVTFDNSLQTTGWYTGTSPNIMPCVGVWGGHLTFKNCTFKVEGTSQKETGVMTWWTGDNKATLNFEGCKFEGINDHANARAMQIYGKVDMTVKNCTFTTYKDYTLKYVGGEGCVAEFEGNNVSNSENFVELGSAPYAGANYTAKFVNNTLNGLTNLWFVAHEEGQKIFENGVQKK
ncbi:MAG: DUF6562 domain-containing protein [Prevotella sp.]|nr:DUF6562 domain-containing protein [Prevotella sp.]